MDKQAVTNLVLGFSLGANLVLAAWMITADRSPPLVHSASVDTAGGMTVATGRLIGKGEGDALYVVDHQEQVMMIYFINAGELQLTHVRDLKLDLKARGHGKQSRIVDPGAEEEKGKK